MSRLIGPRCKLSNGLSQGVLISHIIPALILGFFWKALKGGYTGVVPPDPIPNSEVKDSKADDSLAVCGVKVGSRLLVPSIKKRPFKIRPFCFIIKNYGDQTKNKTEK